MSDARGAAPVERRLLVFGASGAVGEAVCRRAAALGWTVGGVARSGPAPSAPLLGRSFASVDVARLAQDWRPSAVVYAAGVASVAATEADPAAAEAASVAPFLAALDGLARSGAAPMTVLVSSAAVYGQPETLPIAEDAPLRPISAYGRQRVACERALAAYAAATGAGAVAARAFSLFGPGQRKLLVWDLARAALAGAPIVLRGTGRELRDYLSLDAFADRLAALCAGSCAGFDAVNVASGRATPTLDLATHLARLTGASEPVRCLGEARPNDPERWQADVSRLERRLGAPLAPFELEPALAATLAAWRAAAPAADGGGRDA